MITAGQAGVRLSVFVHTNSSTLKFFIANRSFIFLHTSSHITWSTGLIIKKKTEKWKLKKKNKFRSTDHKKSKRKLNKSNISGILHAQDHFNIRATANLTVQTANKRVLYPGTVIWHLNYHHFIYRHWFHLRSKFIWHMHIIAKFGSKASI